MKFTISCTELSKRLTAISRVINSKNALPILGDFLFDIKDGALTITASDSENTVKVITPIIETEGDMSFAIANADLLNAVKSLSDQPVTFDVDNDSHTVRISYQNGQYTMTVNNAYEYPTMPEMSAEKRTSSVTASALLGCINRSVFATANDELRPVMSGVFFDFTEELLAIVASDGHMLVRNQLTTVITEQPFSFILPKKPAMLLRNLLPNDESKVDIQSDERNVTISFGEYTMRSRLIEGRYPNYNSVIPANNPYSLSIDRNSLTAALRRVQTFANTSSNLVRMQVENEAITLLSEDYDFAKNASEKVTCEYDGQPMTIGFKGVSMIEILTSLTGAEVHISIADASRPVLITPSVQPENENILMLQMPMLIS